MIGVIDNTINTKSKKFINILCKNIQKNYIIIQSSKKLEKNKNIITKFISTGSSYNINTMPETIKEMNSKALQSGKPFLGICFGCEFINWFFGGLLSCRDTVLYSCRKVFWNNGKIETHRFAKQCVLHDIYIEKIAKTQNGEIVAIKKDNIKGVMFHPEIKMDVLQLF